MTIFAPFRNCTYCTYDNGAYAKKYGVEIKSAVRWRTSGESHVCKVRMVLGSRVPWYYLRGYIVFRT